MAATAGPSITQGALVSLSRRPSTGPAPQAITERGFAASPAVAAAMASPSPGKSPVSWCGRCRNGVPGPSWIEIRQLVPPTSQTATG